MMGEATAHDTIFTATRSTLWTELQWKQMIVQYDKSLFSQQTIPWRMWIFIQVKN